MGADSFLLGVKGSLRGTWMWHLISLSNDIVDGLEVLQGGEVD